jgi:hypothetical protein
MNDHTLFGLIRRLHAVSKSGNGFFVSGPTLDCPVNEHCVAASSKGGTPAIRLDNGAWIPLLPHYTFRDGNGQVIA